MDSIKNQIKEALNTVREGVTSQNWQHAERYIANDWVSIQNGLKLTWDEQKGMFEHNVSDHKSTFHVENVEVAKDGSMAVCISTEETEYKFGDEKVKEDALFTTVWRKEGDSWKMFHLNRSVNPAQMTENQLKALEEMV